MAALLTVQFNTDDTIKSQKSLAFMYFPLPSYLNNNKKLRGKVYPSLHLVKYKMKNFV